MERAGNVSAEESQEIHSAAMIVGHQLAAKNPAPAAPRNQQCHAELGRGRGFHWLIAAL